MRHFLSHLFTPRSVAIIGASSDADKLGGRPVAHNIEFGFPGGLYPVNAGAGGEVQGLKSYASISDVPEAVDCAIVSVPAAAVEATVLACAARGVKIAVVFSSGFAEFSADGARRQREIAEKARDAGIRLLGPNSMGAMSFAPRFSATFTSINRHFAGKGWPETGVVAVVSQSGAVGTQSLVQLRERGVGLSRWIATGNQSDIDVADAIEFCAVDDATKVIALYMEGAADGAKLVRALQAARRAGKPVIVLKVGRSEAGAKAVASHTASLAGEDRVYDAILAQHGAIRARSFDQLVDFTAACATGIYPARAALGLVTNSGGIGVLMADAAADSGLALPPLSDAAREKIRALAPFGVPGNPADTGAVGMSDIPVNIRFCEVMLADADCPAVIVFFAHLGLLPYMMDRIGAELFALRDKYPDRVIATVVNTTREWTHRLQARGVLVYEDPTRAVEAIGVLARVERGRREIDTPDIPVEPLENPAPSDGFEGERAARRLVARIGVGVAEDRLATTATEAAAAARAFGGRVALKIVSADIAHKSDMGGVALGLSGDAAVEAGFARLMDNAARNAPGARIDGVMVSPMIEGGVECILGVTRDPVFGPMVMFGMGGVFVEVYKDNVLRQAPFGLATAREMISSISGFPMLDGARGRPKMDIEALAMALSRLSAWADRRRDDFASLEINPLIVLPAGAGVVAVDALALPRQEETR